MRRHGVADAYEKLKAISRGKRLDRRAARRVREGPADSRRGEEAPARADPGQVHRPRRRARQARLRHLRFSGVGVRRRCAAAQEIVTLPTRPGVTQSFVIPEHGRPPARRPRRCSSPAAAGTIHLRMRGRPGRSFGTAQLSWCARAPSSSATACCPVIARRAVGPRARDAGSTFAAGEAHAAGRARGARRGEASAIPACRCSSSAPSRGTLVRRAPRGGARAARSPGRC